MPPGISLSPDQRNALLRHYRRPGPPEHRLRAHILLLLADGVAWSAIACLLYTSPSTIARWQRRFRQGGPGAVFGRRRPPCPWWAALIVRRVLQLAPADKGFARSRWSCEAAAIVLAEDHQVQAHPETVRRRLRQAGLAWRRPRPVLRPKDPRRQAKLNALRRLLHNLPEDEAAVFMDEAEVNSNPKIGCMWMLKGRQASVETPGTNEKRLLAGSISWRTGRVILTEGRPGQGRDAKLFCEHLDELRRAFRHYRVIHVICDNVRTHTAAGSLLVRAYLKEWAGRVKVHYLPLHAPECNPIERVWWRLHEAVTRNHRCRTMEELLDLTFEWLSERRFFAIDRRIYQPTAR